MTTVTHLRKQESNANSGIATIKAGLRQLTFTIEREDGGALARVRVIESDGSTFWVDDLSRFGVSHIFDLAPFRSSYSGTLKFIAWGFVAGQAVGTDGRAPHIVDTEVWIDPPIHEG